MIKRGNSGWSTLWGLLQEDSCSAEEASMLWGCFGVAMCCDMSGVVPSMQFHAIPKHGTLKLVPRVPLRGRSGITLRIWKRPRDPRGISVSFASHPHSHSHIFPPFPSIPIPILPILIRILIHSPFRIPHLPISYPWRLGRVKPWARCCSRSACTGGRGPKKCPRGQPGDPNIPQLFRWI